MNQRDEIGVADATVLEASKGIVDGLRIRGHVKLELFGEDGQLKDVREVENPITTIGRNDIVEQLLAAPAACTKPTHMAAGTSNTAEAVGQTTLVAESARVALTSKTRLNNVLTMVGDFAAGVATATLREAGLFVGTGAVTMQSRATFGDIAKGASDTLKVTWTWTIG